MFELNDRVRFTKPGWALILAYRIVPRDAYGVVYAILGGGIYHVRIGAYGLFRLHDWDIEKF